MQDCCCVNDMVTIAECTIFGNSIESQKHVLHKIAPAFLGIYPIYF